MREDNMVEPQKHTAVPFYSNGGTVYNADPRSMFNRKRTNVICYTIDEVIERDESQCIANAQFIALACSRYYDFLEAMKKMADIAWHCEADGSPALSNKERWDIVEIYREVMAKTKAG